MNPVSVDVKDMLEADSSLGLEFGESLFIGRMPSIPDEAIVIFDTMGDAPDLPLGVGGSYFRDSFQIRSRGKSYETAYESLMDIMTSLQGRSHETWNDTLYTVIYSLSSPAFLEWDDNNRVVFIINFEVQRREA